MLRRLIALLLLAGCATVIPQPLVQNINALTARLPHSLWGIVVEDDAGHRLYEKNARALFIPASNRKLFSGATAASCRSKPRQSAAVAPEKSLRFEAGMKRLFAFFS